MGSRSPFSTESRKFSPQTAMIVVKTYNFLLNDSARRFPEVCAYPEEKGFRCVDMCDPMIRKGRRPLAARFLFHAKGRSAFCEQ